MADDNDVAVQQQAELALVRDQWEREKAHDMLQEPDALARQAFGIAYARAKLEQSTTVLKNDIPSAIYWMLEAEQKEQLERRFSQGLQENVARAIIAVDAAKKAGNPFPHDVLQSVPVIPDFNDMQPPYDQRCAIYLNEMLSTATDDVITQQMLVTHLTRKLNLTVEDAQTVLKTLRGRYCGQASKNSRRASDYRYYRTPLSHGNFERQPQQMCFLGSAGELTRRLLTATDRQLTKNELYVYEGLMTLAFDTLSPMWSTTAIKIKRELEESCQWRVQEWGVRLNVEHPLRGDAGDLLAQSLLKKTITPANHGYVWNFFMPRLVFENLGDVIAITMNASFRAEHEATFDTSIVFGFEFDTVTPVLVYKGVKYHATELVTPASARRMIEYALRVIIAAKKGEMGEELGAREELAGWTIEKAEKKLIEITNDWTATTQAAAAQVSRMHTKKLVPLIATYDNFDTCEAVSLADAILPGRDRLQAFEECLEAVEAWADDQVFEAEDEDAGPVAEDYFQSHRPGKVNVAYFVNWGIYARNYKPFESQVPVESLTHLLYAFANIRDTGEVFLTDQWADEQIHYDGDDWNDPDASTNLYGNFKQLYLLKKRHRHLKILLSIGGWTYSSNFAGPASSVQGRKTFVESSVKLLEDYGLDGLDLDWEYPKNDVEARNYVELLRDLRQGLDAHAAKKGLSPEQGYELTIAAPCGASNYEKLHLKEMDQYLSFWNLMAYDYAGSWDTITGHQAALFDDGRPNAVSTDRAIRHFTSHGVPVSKLVLGLPLYGRSFLNTENGPGHTYQGVGQGSWEQGSYDFKALPLAGSVTGCDPNLVAAWCYDSSKREWVTYDTVESAVAKAEFVNVNGLAGCMYWEASGDKPKGSGQSIIENVANVLQRQGTDNRRNCLDYSESKWTNLRQGMS
ncbi:hypothetical protein ACM66B_003685 [Microbotryomycetes sp. NB124-2]